MLSFGLCIHSCVKTFFNFCIILCAFSVMAACSIANIVKSSLGPVGLDKMLVDDVGVRHFHFCCISRVVKISDCKL